MNDASEDKGQYVTSCAKTYTTAIHSKLKNRSFAVCHPFVMDGMLFKRIGLSVQKKILVIWRAEVIHFNGWGYAFGKNCHLFKRLRSSVFLQTADVIRSKKSSRSKGWCFERLLLFYTKLISRSIRQRYLMGFGLELSVQKELYIAARIAVFDKNKHSTFPIQMAMFVCSERKTVFKITVQETNTGHTKGQWLVCKDSGLWWKTEMDTKSF